MDPELSALPTQVSTQSSSSMASKTGASAALLLALNVLLFSMVSGCGHTCVPTPIPTIPKPPPVGKCPIDALKLGVCVNVLNGLITLDLGKPPKEPCCSLIKGLADLEAAVCLCTVLKANVLGLISLNLPINLSLLVNYCGKSVPTGFICPWSLVLSMLTSTLCWIFRSVMFDVVLVFGSTRKME